MDNRTIYDQPGHAHFVTFSCYKRRLLLNNDKPKKIVVGVLDAQLSKYEAYCIGFVVMPQHVHSILWFHKEGQFIEFIKQWKRLSSYYIKQYFKENMDGYSEMIDLSDPVWQSHYYDFNITEPGKLKEKLTYIHNNPVKAGLVDYPDEWPFGSARYFEDGRAVGVRNIGFPVSDFL